MRKPKLNFAEEREVRPRFATKHEKAVIVRLSGRRTQRQIGQFLGRSRRFVQEWQEKLGCQRKHEPNANDKREIIRLYHAGKGQARIAKITGVPQSKVRRTLLEACIPIHPAGDVRFALPPAQFAKFRKDVLSKRFYCVELAKKYGLTRHNSLRLAKEILGVETFLRGRTFPPLSSVFPQRQTHDARCTVGDCMSLLGKIFPSGLPTSPDWIVVPAVVDLLCEVFPFWRSASAPVLENLETHLVAAIGTMRGAEASLVN